MPRDKAPIDFIIDLLSNFSILFNMVSCYISIISGIIPEPGSCSIR
jgi:hypothetical protein